MKITVDVWRQSGPESSGAFDTYQIDDATVEMSLLELLDRLNDQLVESGNEPIAFDSDCREGICGSCGITVDDLPHGPVANTPTCRQHLRSFSDGDRIKLEPFRSAAFPVVRDLVVDRSALDRVLEAGGYVSCQCRNRAGRRQSAALASKCRSCTGLRRVHRLRRLRGSLPERCRAPLHRVQTYPPVSRHAGPQRTWQAGPSDVAPDGGRFRAVLDLR